MKRILIIFAIALCVALALPLYLNVHAQPNDPSYMDAYKPDTAERSREPRFPDGVTPVQRQLALDDQLDGQAVRTELNFSMESAPTEETWTALTARFADAVSGQIAEGSGETAKQLARSVEKAVRAQIDDSAETLAGGRVYLTGVKVTTPYFEELKVGSKGDHVRTLQEKLIALGYLTGTADGDYGNMTAGAVTALEQYVRQIEQDEIDANATPTPIPTPTADPAATPDPDATIAPTPEPAPTPETEADGIADATLQTFLMSADFPSARANLNYGDQSDAVLRFQNRLAALGYLIGTPDGFYGANTQLSVRLLQSQNGQEQNGSADVELQDLVFSGSVNALADPILQNGSNGDDVRKLQKELRTLGFMTGSPDGSYGPATVGGVENLQTYLRTREMGAITASAIANGTPEADVMIDEVNLTTVVNGIADPLLLDKLYSVDFPAIPDTLRAGSSGDDVRRVQRRLYGLEYLFTSADGAFGNGTAQAITDFQKQAKLPQTGIADRDTLELLFSDSAKVAIKPYLLKVSTSKQRVYVYGLDANGAYTKLLRTMKCSTGKDVTPTPKGTYQGTTGPGARWHYFKKFDIWAQYAYYIEGDYMIHSVLFQQKGGTATWGSVHNLGSKASHGCVRLAVEDAKWIYENCPPKTKVVVS